MNLIKRLRRSWGEPDVSAEAIETPAQRSQSILPPMTCEEDMQNVCRRMGLHGDGMGSAWNHASHYREEVR